MRLAMEIGEPYTPPGAKAVTNQHVVSLRFVGHYGEMLQIMKDKQRPRGPRLTLASLDGTYRYTNTFEFG